MSIRDWPETERPREKLLANGAAALSDAELLAVFLRTGVAGLSAVDLARELLSAFGGLRSLLSADVERFCAAKGLGRAKYAQLQAVLELSRRHLAEELRREGVLRDPGSTRRFLQARLRDETRELFGMLLLDNQHQVLAFEVLAIGTINAAAVYPREVVKAALRRNAAAVIFAHNHPSGVAEPSAADRELTERLITALRTVDIRVLDHVIVGEDCVSFAERGMM
ncbi:DNA repair protein RadC [Algiphilus sp. NNCM1]|uniref:RadC family protein n=1 Tax=Algiphilus sp. TaxID=1872431 RepID=UPI001CA6292B|nr:DNA repair protein RadC [Algiphilus sp.]MBY8966337.1 DNA repair protein RadC [Algiphilus acroporae]MCI5062266.1 DNA repair protein RadC [Algiphilus sp.]MCI5102202.1 DNA repair protein RadC [Algiphilus sp.]